MAAWGRAGNQREVRTIALWQNGLRPRITAEYIGSNFFHNASQFSLVGQLSLIDKRLVGTYQQPYIFGIKNENSPERLSGEEKKGQVSVYARQGFQISTKLPGDFSLAGWRYAEKPQVYLSGNR